MKTDQRPYGLEWSLLAYLTSITLLITLVPFRFRWPTSIHILWFAPWFDVITNVLLFLPLGFLYRLTRRRGRSPGGLHVFLLAIGFSSAIEIAQLFLEGRYTSFSDVVANSLGAWLGAMLCERAQRYLSPQWLGRLGLE